MDVRDRASVSRMNMSRVSVSRVSVSRASVSREERMFPVPDGALRQRFGEEVRD